MSSFESLPLFAKEVALVPQSFVTRISSADSLSQINNNNNKDDNKAVSSSTSSWLPQQPLGLGALTSLKKPPQLSPYDALVSSGGDLSSPKHSFQKTIWSSNPLKNQCVLPFATTQHEIDEKKKEVEWKNTVTNLLSKTSSSRHAASQRKEYDDDENTTTARRKQHDLRRRSPTHHGVLSSTSSATGASREGGLNSSSSARKEKIEKLRKREDFEEKLRQDKEREKQEKQQQQKEKDDDDDVKSGRESTKTTTKSKRKEGGRGIKQHQPFVEEEKKVLIHSHEGDLEWFTLEKQQQKQQEQQEDEQHHRHDVLGSLRDQSQLPLVSSISSISSSRNSNKKTLRQQQQHQQKSTVAHHSVHSATARPIPIEVLKQQRRLEQSWMTPRSLQKEMYQLEYLAHRYHDEKQIISHKQSTTIPKQSHHDDVINNNLDDGATTTTTTTMTTTTSPNKNKMNKIFNPMIQERNRDAKLCVRGHKQDENLLGHHPHFHQQQQSQQLSKTNLTTATKTSEIVNETIPLRHSPTGSLQDEQDIQEQEEKALYLLQQQGLIGIDEANEIENAERENNNNNNNNIDDLDVADNKVVVERENLRQKQQQQQQQQPQTIPAAKQSRVLHGTDFVGTNYKKTIFEKNRMNNTHKLDFKIDPRRFGGTDETEDDKKKKKNRKIVSSVFTVSSETCGDHQKVLNRVGDFGRC